MFKQTTYKRIDDAHNEMLEIIQDIEDHSNDPEYMKDQIKYLIEFTDRHFEDENSLMRDSHYKDYKNHYDSHRYKILELFSFYREGWDVDVYAQKVNDLKKWFDIHILQYDDPLAEFLLKKSP